MQKKYKTLIVLLLLLIVSGAIVFGYQRLTQTAPEKPTPQTKSSSHQSSRDTGKIESSPQDANAPEGNRTPEATEGDTYVALHDGAGQSHQQHPDTTQHSPIITPHAAGPHRPPATPGTPSQQPAQPTPPPQPPVVPPTQPPVTPTPPPKPPQPPVTPPQQNLTDEEKALKIINDLKSSTNQNVAQFTNDEGQVRTVLWTKGITGPHLGAGGDFKRVEEIHGSQQFITYATGYRNEFLTAGWYDADKTHGSSNVDRLLCFGAVAANQLHWWMNYHKDRVEQFIVKTNYRNNLPPSQRGTFKDLTTYQDSFKGQQNSRFFKMISLYFGNNSEGYYADPLIDMFINGHKPKPGGGSNDPDWEHSFQMDSRGGFFHDVFRKRNITRRLVPSDFKDFTNEMKKAFRDGESVGIIHHTSAQNTHIITAWGLEYDLDGNLMAVYITDSDDQDDPKTGGMKRYNIKNVNNRAVMSTNVTNLKAGGVVDSISTLGLGEDKWEEYLN